MSRGNRKARQLTMISICLVHPYSGPLDGSSSWMASAGITGFHTVASLSLQEASTFVHRTAGLGSETERELLGLLSNWHTTVSPAFCWLKQIKRPAHIQGVTNRLVLLIGVSAKSGHKGCRYRRTDKLGLQSVSLTVSSLKKIPVLHLKSSH